jgi:glucokinase
MGVLIGIDVGSTTTSGGLVTPEGEVLWATQAPTQAGGPGSALDTLLEIVGQLLDQAAKRCLSPEGIGVGVVGVVDVDAGTLSLMAAGRMPELTGVPLVELVQGRSGGGPVFVDNDVNALALGEWTFGLGRGAASMAMLALGTGVGGALILDGHLVRGHRGYAGEFGHVTVNLDGRRCQACGNQGCLAVYTAGHGIAMEARRRGRLEGSPTADEPDIEPPVSDAAAVFRAAAEGDADARGVVEEAVHALGAGIGGIVNGYNPELIVVTGGIVKSLARLEREILDCAREHSLAPAFAGTRIHLIPADKSQTVRGGAALVLYERACRAALR